MRLPLENWTELLEACHSVPKVSSPCKKSVKKHVHELLRLVVTTKCLVRAISHQK